MLIIDVTPLISLDKAGFPLANIFARSDFFPLSLSFRLKPSGTNYVETKEKSRFARKYSLVENRLNDADALSDVAIVKVKKCQPLKQFLESKDKNPARCTLLS